MQKLAKQKTAQRIKAIALKVPQVIKQDPNKPSTWQFNIVYIDDLTKTLICTPCSPRVYQKIISQNLTRAFTSEFTLVTKAGTNIVERIETKEKEGYFNPVYGDIISGPDADFKSDSTDIDVIIFIKYEDAGLELKVKPANVKDDVVEEIREALVSAGDTVRAYDILAGKYLVKDTRQEGTYIHVDPNPR